MAVQLILNRAPGIAGQLLLNLRDASRHEDRAALRWNMQRMGRELGSALAQSWPMAKATCTTPLGTAAEDIPAHQPVMACILRAAMPLHQGVLDYVWDRADSAFVSAYRKHHDAGFDIEIEYLGAPAMEGRALVVIDPMLATGASLQAAYDALCETGVLLPRSTSLPPSRAKKALSNAQQWLPEGTSFILGGGRSRPQRTWLHCAWIGGCGRLGVWSQDSELSHTTPNWWKWCVVWWRTSAFASSALMAPCIAQSGILELPALTEQRRPFVLQGLDLVSLADGDHLVATNLLFCPNRRHRFWTWHALLGRTGPERWRQGDRACDRACLLEQRQHARQRLARPCWRPRLFVPAREARRRVGALDVEAERPCRSGWCTSSGTTRLGR